MPFEDWQKCRGDAEMHGLGSMVPRNSLWPEFTALEPMTLAFALHVPILFGQERRTRWSIYRGL
jgi:hypothetical protein